MSADAPSLPRGWRNQRGAAEATLAALRAKKLALNPPEAYGTPGALARAIDPTTVQTPALDLIDAALVRVANRESTRLIISMPPQEGKSQRTTHYGALWMLHRNQNLRIAIVSYSDAVSRKFSYQIRSDITTYNGYQGALDLGMQLRRDNKAAGEWALQAPKQGSMYATGIGGGLTGIPVDMLLIDDPVKDFKAAESMLLSDQAWEWWSSVARPRLAPGAPVILILTRWHENDLAGRLLQKQKEDAEAGLEDYDQWEVINIPAQADFDPEKGETDPLGRQPGEFMVSARGRTDAQWRATKAATNSRSWNALYMGRPSPDAGDVWKRADWRIYNRPQWSLGFSGTDRVYRITEGEYDDLIMSWDMTFKDSNGADFVVGQVWMRRGPDAFLLDQVRERMGFTDTVKAFEAMVLKWPQARAKLVEDKANGSAVMETLRKKIPGIVAVEPMGSKYARASAVAPFIEAGGVHLPSSDIALFPVDEFIEEAASFPNGAHDDQVDSASQALARFFIGNALVSEWLAEMRRLREAEEAAEAAKNADIPTVDPITDARHRAFRAQQGR